MTSVSAELVISTSQPWESIWSTQCHPMHSRGPLPGSIQHRPSHKPHTDAKASETHRCLSPGRVVAVQVKKKRKTGFLISHILCLRSNNLSYYVWMGGVLLVMHLFLAQLMFVSEETLKDRNVDRPHYSSCSAPSYLSISWRVLALPAIMLTN